MADERDVDGADPSDDEMTAPVDGDGDVDFEPFADEEPFEPRPMQAVMGPDGLATLPDNTAESDIPVLSPETMVCMGDFSAFVIRDRWGAILAQFAPESVSRSGSGCWRVSTKLAIEVMKLPSPLGFAQLTAQLPTHYRLDAEWVEVLPLRPECTHYVRQLEHPGSIDGATVGIMLRACAARRDTSGAMMNLRNTGILACSLRDPWIPEADGKLESFDARKVQQGRERRHLSIFDSMTSAEPIGSEKE